MKTRLKNTFLLFSRHKQESEKERLELISTITTQSNRKKLIKEISKEALNKLVASGKVGAISHTVSIYYRSLRHCSINDSACSHQLNRKLGYIGFSFAIADLLFYIASKSLKNHPLLAKLYKYWHGLILDIMSIHGFLLQFALFVHQEIIFGLEKNEEGKEITTSNEVFITEIVLSALFALGCNAKIRELIRSKVLCYPPLESNQDTRSLTHKSIDLSAGLVNGFASGRSWLLGLENFIALFYRYQPAQSSPAIWLRWSAGIIDGIATGLRSFLLPINTNTHQIIEMKFIDQIPLFLSALLLTSFTLDDIRNASSPDKEIQAGLFSFLLLLILFWAWISKCCYLFQDHAEGLKESINVLNSKDEHPSTNITSNMLPIYGSNTQSSPGIFHPPQENLASIEGEIEFHRNNVL